MAKRSELDMTEVEWPVCLLAFKKHLDSTCRGRSFDALIRDPAVVEAVKMIVQNASCRITKIEHETDRFRIRIRKHASSKGPAAAAK